MIKPSDSAVFRPYLAVKQQAGYVLLLTLVFIVILSLSVGFFAQKIDIARTLAKNSQARADTEIQIHNQLNSMLYRLAVVRPSMAGIGAGQELIRVDNQPYQAADGIIVRVMDQRGLQSLRYIDPLRLARLLGEFGVPQSKQTPLIEALQDYIDADSDRRLNGAEAPQYAAADLPPPANQPLDDVKQLKQVYGWREQTQLWQSDAFTRLLTTAPVAGINPNAAPAQILATLPNVDLTLADTLVRYRQKNPIDFQLMSQLTGMNGMQMQFTVFPFPSTFLRLTFSCVCPHPVMQYNVVLTPNSNEAPWHFERVSQQDALSPQEPHIQHAQNAEKALTQRAPIDQLPPIVNSPPVQTNLFSP